MWWRGSERTLYSCVLTCGDVDQRRHRGSQRSLRAVGRAGRGAHCRARRHAPHFADVEEPAVLTPIVVQLAARTHVLHAAVAPVGEAGVGPHRLAVEGVDGRLTTRVEGDGRRQRVARPADTARHPDILSTDVTSGPPSKTADCSDNERTAM